jgi:methionyl-tRNA synthetase
MNILNAGVGSGFANAPVPLLLFIIAWSLFWKGLALWHAGRRGQPWWFVIMLVVNTVGILEIIYLFAVLKLKFGELFKK